MYKNNHTTSTNKLKYLYENILYTFNGIRIIIKDNFITFS